MLSRLSAAARKTYAAAFGALVTPTASAVDAGISDLPVDVLRVVFRFLADDVASLCAAACVKRSWHAAVLQPALWRDLRFAEQPDVARRLTDTRLELLVRRAGAALRCLDLADCGVHCVTMRGVVKALRDAPLLKQLGVRGLQYGTRRSGPAVTRYAQLSALMCPDDGLLDAAEFEGGLLLCDAELNGGLSFCRRLFTAEDELCAECVLFYCRDCQKAAAEKREPPCEHLCDTCFQRPEDDFFFDCGDTRCNADAVNGHCVECCTMCSECEKFLCYKCAYDDYGMMMCRSGSCTYHSDEQFCDDCIYPAPLHPWDVQRKLIFCEGCEELVCPRCMDLQKTGGSSCQKCYKEFCGSCRKKHLTALAKRVWMCTRCAKEGE